MAVTTVVLLARIVLAAVFVVSAVAKFRDRPGSRQAVVGFGVPVRLAAPVAAALPVVELGCAGLLVVADPAATVGALVALLLLAAFTVAIVVNLRRGNRIDCHCFGQIGAASIGWTTVARNAGLMVLAAVSLVGAGSLGSVPAVLADYTAPELAAGSIALLLTAAVVVLATAMKTLMVRYGSVLLRLEALEMVTGTAPPKLAPHFALPDLDGRLVDLNEVLGLEKPTLVAFISPSCRLCDQLLPDLERWQQDATHPLSVIVLSTGSDTANRDKIGTWAVQVLLHDGALTADYDMRGTPAAYLLGVDGLIAAPTAYGVEAIRALHDTTVSAVTGSHNHDDHALAAGVPVAGDLLPDLDVTTDHGTVVSVAELVGEQAVLLFWRSTCGFCAGIVAEVAALERATRIILVSSTDTQSLRDSGLTSVIAREEGAALSRALQVPGTPSAVRVRRGRLDSALAVGGPAVTDLLRLSAMTGAERSSAT